MGRLIVDQVPGFGKRKTQSKGQQWKTRGIRTEAGDLKPGQGLRKARSRESGNPYQKAPWNPGAQGRPPESERGCSGLGQLGSRRLAGSWRRPMPLSPDSGRL